MKIVNPRMLAAGAVAVLAALAAGAAPAMASGPPCTGTCSSGVSGTVAVSENLSLSLSVTSFSLSGAPGTTVQTPATGFGGAAGTATVLTNDPSGYLLAASAPSFAGPGSATISNHNLSVASSNGGPNTPVAPFYQAVAGADWTAANISPMMSQASAVAGDVYPLGYQVAIPAGTAAGTFTTTVTYLLVGN